MSQKPEANAKGSKRSRAKAAAAVASAARWAGQEVVIAERRVKALHLRKSCASYRQIATLLGVSLETAYSDVQAEMAQLHQLAEDSADELRTLERHRLDQYALAASRMLEDAGVDPGDKVRAIAVLVKIQDRRAKLEGLDAPRRVAVEGSLDTGGPSLSAVDLSALSVEELLQLRTIAKKSEAAAAAAAALAAGVTA